MWVRILLLISVCVAGCVPARPPEASVPVAVAAPAASRLRVTSVVPDADATAVQFDSSVFVEFNRPVVPLATLDHPSTDNPLQIRPPVDGKGHWINTGVYTFTPTVGWAPSTTYQIRVPRTDFEWSFSTLPPAVGSTSPPPAAWLVDPGAALRVTINQPVDPATVHFSMAPAVEGTIDWPDGRTLVFKPDSPLVAGQRYAASIAIANSAKSYDWTFTTAPEPRVIRSVPMDGGAEALRLGTLELFFSAPMDRDEVRGNLQVEPQLDYPASLRWTDDDTHVAVYAVMKPTTEYTVSLPAGTRDRFGRALQSSFSLTFTTPPREASPKAAPVRPQAWLISPGPVGTYNAYEHSRALLRTTNVTHVDYSVDALDERTVVETFQSLPIAERLPDGRRVADGAIDVESDNNTPTLNEIDLGGLAPGYYRLRVNARETDARIPDHLVVVTRTMLAVKESETQVLIWATDLRTGAPLPDLPVRFLRPDTGSPLAKGTTDASGTLQVNLTAATLPTLVVADRDDDATLALGTWSGGVGPWTFGLPSVFFSQPLVAHVYSDRPIYRPGQMVHLKGIVRADDDAHYSLPPASFSGTWQVQDSQSRVVGTGSIDSLSDFGTFNADIELSPDAATGNYSFKLTSAAASTSKAQSRNAGLNKGSEPPPIAWANFLVAEYQRPEFEVALDNRDAITAGQPLAEGLRAAYYFGQPLSGAAVHWQVTSQSYAFNWPSDPTFRFGDTASPEDWLTLSKRPDNAARLEGKGHTAADGSFAFQVPTDLSHDLASQRFTIEATVTDPDHREVSNRQVVIVHKADVYLGLRPNTFVAQAGQEQTIQLVTLDTRASPMPGVSVHGQVLRRRWLSVRGRDAQGELRWVSHAEDTPLSSLVASSGADGRGLLTFTPDEGGEYRVVVEAADESGNLARTAISVWVAGPGFIPWRMNEDGRLSLQADKSSYQPGDVAHVIVPAPVTDANALITVERGRLISHSVERLAGNSTVLDIPIGTEHIPNAYVSVVLFGGGDAPKLSIGYVELPVSSNERQLQVSAEPDRRDHGTRDIVPFTIRTRDAGGRAVPAEVSVALVDVAVLALAESPSDPVSAFWRRRPLGIRSGSTLGASIDRLNDAVSSGLKGGGGGDQGAVRQEFPDTAFWLPSVRTDLAGEAHVDIRLPDTLTTWRLTAVAVTRDTRVGVGTSDVVTSKPLLVRPIVPRFLIGGDVASIGAAIHNTTGTAMAVSVVLDANELTVQGEAQRTITVPSGGQTRVDWPVNASHRQTGETGKATLHFSASSTAGSDVVDVTLPLLAWGIASTVATAGEVGPADTVTEVVDLPREVDRSRGELRLELAASLAGALRVSLAQVEEYPYECLEQTVSRFLPRLALERAINKLGLGDPLHLSPELPGLVNRSLSRIYHFQHSDGGWGWWTNDTSHPYVSAYAVFGLVEARRAGFDVDQRAMDRGVQFLRQWLNAEPGPFGLDTRAYVVYVLGEAGAREPSRAAALFDRRADLGITARAYLAQALATIDPADERVGGLLAELTNNAVVSATGTHWEEPTEKSSIVPWMMATGVRTTSAILDALIRLRPDHPLVHPAVRWLMMERRDDRGYWRSTHDTASSVLALSDYLSTSGELQGSFGWQVGLNGKTRQSGTIANFESRMATTEVLMPILELVPGANRVDMMRSVGDGRLYYTLQLKSFSSAADAQFESRGFSVAREYLSQAGEPLTQAHVGDLVQVQVTVVTPSELHDLVIEDPLPAGFEPLDTRLKTTSEAVRSAQRSAQMTAGRQPWTHVDVRADRVALFASHLTRGGYQYTYLARASLAGDYRVLPTNGREQYFPEVFARGDGRHFTIQP